MAKTLRQLTRTGWTTKPSEDLPENRLTAAEVDATLLALESEMSSSVSVERFQSGATITFAEMQNAINTLTADGRGVYIPAGTYEIPADSVLELPSGALIVAHPMAILINAAAATMPVMTNVDRVNGNTNIRVYGGQWDGNRAQAPAGQRYSAITFHGLTDSVFRDMHVQGGCRKTATSQGYPGSGEGLEFVRCYRVQVIGGTFRDCDYDGVKFRNVHDSVLIGAAGKNNGRGLIQVTGESGGLGAKSTDIVITGCTVSHDTGLVADGSAAPYTSGYAIHTADRVQIIGNSAYGMRCPIDALEDANDSLIADNFLSPRYADSRGAIWLREWNGAVCNRNVVRGNVIKPISGSNGIYIYINGNDNIVEGNRLLTGSGTGTWRNENIGARNRWVLNHPQPAVTFSETGTDTVRLELSATTLALNGLDFVHEVGAAPAGTVTISDVTPSETSAVVTYSYSSDDATSYEARLDSGTAFAIGASPGTVSGLTSGQTYSLQVRAVNAAGAGDWSVASEFTTTVAAAAPAGTPTIGTISTTDTGASVPYTYSEGDSDGFEYRLDGGTAVDATTTNPIVVSGLTAETAYGIEVRAYNSVGSGSWSSVAPFTTAAASAYDTDATAVISAVEATDAGALDTTTKDAIDAFVVDGKTNGWWAKLANVYGLVGGTAAAHGIDWKAPSGTRVTWSGTLTHSALGVKGGGGSGDSGINASTTLARNDHCIGFICNQEGVVDIFEGIVGAGISTDVGALHIQQGGNNSLVARLASSSGAATVDGTPSSAVVGHIQGARVSATNSEIYVNNVASKASTSGDNSLADPVNENLHILSRGAAGPTFAGRLSLAYWGASLTSGERDAFHTAATALQTALGR